MDKESLEATVGISDMHSIALWDELNRRAFFSSPVPGRVKSIKARIRKACRSGKHTDRDIENLILGQIVLLRKDNRGYKGFCTFHGDELSPNAPRYPRFEMFRDGRRFRSPNLVESSRLDAIFDELLQRAESAK